MKDSLYETLVTLRLYLKEKCFSLTYSASLQYKREGITVLQNVASTCILEIENQRALGIEIPEPPPALRRFLNAGMHSATNEDGTDGKVSTEADA